MNYTIYKLKAPKVILKILLITGEERAHIVDVPNDLKLAIKFIEEMLKKIITATFTTAIEPFVVPSTPITAYNAHWIVAIEYSFIGAEEFEDTIKKDRGENAPRNGISQAEDYLVQVNQD